MGKYGFVILNLEMDPAQVDCNVHPAKLEVRFAEEQKVFKAVYHAIKSKIEDIMVKVQNQPEIENQEQIVAPSEKENENNEEIKDKEEFKPREGTFSGFFKMFQKEDKKEKNNDNNTLIEDLYNKKQSVGLSWDNLEKEEEKLEKDIEKVENELEGKSLFEKNNNLQEEYVQDEKINPVEKNIQPESFSGLDKIENISNEVDVNLEDNSPKQVKFGNTIISSDTRESAYSVEDLMKEAAKQNTVEIDIAKELSANDSKTEVIDSIKKIDEDNNRETIIINTDEVRNEITGNEEKNVEQPVVVEEVPNNKIAEKLLEQKVNSNMNDTQFIDTGKVRSEIRKMALEEDIPMTKDFANMYKKVFGMDVFNVRKTKEEENAKIDFSNNIQIAENLENESVFDEPKAVQEVPAIQYRFIGIVFDTYAIIEVKDEMYMIDKNAAEERLMYEIVKQNYDNEIDDSVTLLLADIVTLSPKEMSMARDLEKIFNRAGFEYDEFGEATLKLTKVPSWAESLNTKKLFIETLREMDTVAVTATKEKEDKFIASLSNKFVELADTKLTEQELEDLINRLLKLKSPFMYPNGKLTAVKITKANMEKKFSRR